ncbi:MAG: CBS domain-containing protein [Acidimicrobiales bacterium]
MTYEPLSLKPSDPVDRARDLMLAFGIHGIPVIDDGRLLGIVTSHDLVDDWPPTEPVRNIMSGDVLTIDIRAGLGEAAELMKARLVHHLVVTDGLEPVGVITTYDLLDALIGSDRE